jgi:hypothetical protein
MKRLILLLLLIMVALTASGCNKVVQITIVIPPTLVPYYQWLVEFPGWQSPILVPSTPTPTGVQGYQTVTPRNQFVAKPILAQHSQGLFLI